MADQDMFEQTSILKDIRTELRTSRMESHAGGAGPSRPSQAFIQSQHTADRMLAGQWGQLGWANAYKSQIDSSLANDIMGSMGLRAAPQTMWQNEYESASRSLLTDRLSAAPFALFAPGFAARSRRMGDEMFAYAGRFNRSGDMGRPDIGQMRSMARDLQITAAGDMRLSGRDYESIMSEGLKSGQFDFGSSASDLASTFKQLRDATADLTKSLRVGAGEVGQLLGTFRQAGITDIADQRRMAERLGASARVAGLSVPEMGGSVMAAIAAGAGMGIGAGTSAGLVENSIMGLRTMSRSGMVSQAMIAAGGGIQSMADAQTSAIQRFLSSSSGFYGAVGAGGGGGFMNQLMRGIGATGGTMSGIAAFEANKIDYLSRLSTDQAEGLFDASISQQLSYLGLRPGTAAYGNQAKMLLRGIMGDAAGNAYGQLHFTAEGQATRARTAYLAEAEAYNQRRDSDYTRRYENETAAGQFRQSVGWLSQLPGRGMRALGNWMSPGQTGIFGFGGQFDADAYRAGPVGTLNLGATGDLFGGPRGSGDVIVSGGAGMGGALFGGVGAGMGLWAGTKTGALAGAGLGSYFGPWGTAIGGAAVGIIGGGLGVWGGWNGGGAVGGAVSDLTTARTVLRGADADAYREVFMAQTGPAMSGAQSLALNARMRSNSAWRQLTEKQDVGELTGAEAATKVRLMQEAGKAAGMSAGEIMRSLKGLGVDMSVSAPYSGIDDTGKLMDGLKPALQGLSSGVNYRTADMAEAIGLIAEGSDTTRALGLQKLMAGGASAADQSKLLSNINSMGGRDRSALVQTARGATLSANRDEARRGMDIGLTMGQRAVEMVSDVKTRDALKSRMGGMGGLDFVRAVRGGKFHDLADSGLGILGQTFSGIEALGSLDLNKSADLERAASISHYSASSIKDFKGGREQLMDWLAYGAITGGQQQANSPSNLAGENMKLAANILEKIVKDLQLK